jgi:RNA polymerase sigma factor (sigma-70 family)
MIHSICRSCELGAADADDVLQTVFLRLHLNLHRVRDGERVAGWLATTAQREARIVARRLRAHRGLGVREVEDEPDDVGGWSRADLQQTVREAMDELGGRGQTLLNTLFSATGSGDRREIAQALGLRSGSIGPIRARAFRRLEDLLRGKGLGPGAFERHS